MGDFNCACLSSCLLACLVLFPSGVPLGVCTDLGWVGMQVQVVLSSYHLIHLFPYNKEKRLQNIKISKKTFKEGLPVYRC